MRKSLVGVILALVFLFEANAVAAASSCSYSEQAELNNKAANVRTTYEIVEVKDGTAIDVDNSTTENQVVVDVIKKGFNISVLNITDDIFVKISNNKNSNVQTFKSNDATDGVVTFQTMLSDDIVTYTIEVYSNKYECAGDLIRKYTMITPMYNKYSALQVCADNPDFYYCKEFISTENISFDMFYRNLEKYQTQEKQEEEKENKQTLLDKIKDYYHAHAIAINIAGSIVVIAGVTTTAILIKKRRSRVL